MKKIFGTIFLRIFKWIGWTMVGDLPPGLNKAVMVVAPHTSNWDAVYGIFSIVFIKNIAAKFAVKKEAMFFPLGLILKQMGAIPINRSIKTKTGSKLKQADMLAEMFQNSKELILVIAPEGTRKYAPRWKTGFYHIAMKAQVPIILGYLDYAKKEAGIGPVIYPTGNMEQDMEQIQTFFKDKKGKYPHQGVR
jgi:1-acyl-sn-glycerol-3-phosphate acyltransferase